MIKLYLLILAVLHGANSQWDCVPEPVEWIRLGADFYLSWGASTNCQDIKYIAYMFTGDGEVAAIFETLSTSIHVNLLPMCETITFTVVAIGRETNIASPDTTVNAKTPANPGTNVTVAHIHATPQSEDSVLLEWELDEEYAHCVQFFRVVHWDGEGVPVDVYTSYDSVVLEDLAPCTRFQFTVTPIYNSEEEGGIGVLTYETPAHNLHTPTLVEVRPGPTFVDMTWQLPPYVSNRCTISSIVVDGSPYVNLRIPITDTVSRPNVRVHVSSLQPDRMYLFRVSVVNAAGPSQPVPIGIQTLPAAKVSN